MKKHFCNRLVTVLLQTLPNNYTMKKTIIIPNRQHKAIYFKFKRNTNYKHKMMLYQNMGHPKDFTGLAVSCVSIGAQHIYLHASNLVKKFDSIRFQTCRYLKNISMLLNTYKPDSRTEFLYKNKHVTHVA